MCDYLRRRGSFFTVRPVAETGNGFGAVYFNFSAAFLAFLSESI